MKPQDTHRRISSIRCRSCYLFRCLFCVATIRGRRLLLWKAWWHQQWLDKVLYIWARCWWLLDAVSCGNDSYNTNSPSISMVTVVRNPLHTHLHVVFTSHGHYSRAATIRRNTVFKDCSASMLLLIDISASWNERQMCMWLDVLFVVPSVIHLKTHE